MPDSITTETSEDDSSSDESPSIPAKRPRSDTYGASSTTSLGSALLESDDEHSESANNDSRPNSVDIRGFNKADPKYKEQSPTDSIRLSRSSMSENCSSPIDQYDDRPGLEDNNENGDGPAQFGKTMDSNFYAKDQESDTSSNDHIQGGYSAKAKKMMSMMGYKHGLGLGKFEHGRTEPVEASNQKGRRGLGAMPSAIGDVPADFKWSPDDDKAEAKEEVTWMPKATETPLEGDQLDEWLKKGAKKLTIDDETDFVDPQILKGVLNAKTIFDTLDDEDLRHARFRSNPYETIGSVIFLNRAAVKMANIDAIYDFHFTKPKKQNGESALDKKEILYFADVCAGPGGFSEYVLYRKGWRAKGFGFTLRGQNDFKLSDFYAGSPETFNPYYGIEGDGNIFNPNNLSSLKDHVLKQTEDKGVHFLMADGGFSVEGQENLQEILSHQLYLCQCLAALMLVRTGGHFVVKLFDIFTPFSVGLVYIMYRCFDRVSIHKPVTSRPANSERYLVCMWKRVGCEAAESHLYAVNDMLWANSDLYVTQLVPMSVIQENRGFYEIGERQIKNLLKIGEFSKNKSLKESSQVEMREKCLELWQIPDKVRIQPERMNPDDTLAKILTEMHKKPPEASSPLSFKSSVLGKPPTYLDSLDDVKTFRNVLDWHFVILNSGRNSQDLKFFLGCGGKKVFQLDGLKWHNVVDLHISMPSKTLIYGEVVKECRGEGNNQMHTKALHIIDAVMLGGVDISNLPLTERLSQCALFCAALEKPFDKQAMPLRCKRLFGMEHFAAAVGNLQYRAMKRVRRAVTVDVPNRTTRVDMFHVVGSLLFIKEIREPWEARMSRSSGHKYFFGPGKDKRPRSEYFIPEEARLDTLGGFARRVQWPWKPPSAVLDSVAHDGVTRAEMEQYIHHNVNR